MEHLIKAENLKKTFKFSKKQQKLEKTNATHKVAVDGVSFKCFAGEIRP
jgi:sodium transport system ATP-binding protein